MIEYIPKDKVSLIKREVISAESILGKLLCTSCNYSLYSVVSDDYDSNGISLIRNQDISMVRYDTDFLNKLSNILIDFKINFDELKLDSIESFISSLESEASIITFHLEELDDETCYLLELGSLKFFDGLISGIEINTTGKVDGKIIFFEDEVTKIDILGKYEKNLEAL